jgi:hypothetical protein
MRKEPLRCSRSQLIAERDGEILYRQINPRLSAPSKAFSPPQAKLFMITSPAGDRSDSSSQPINPK